MNLKHVYSATVVVFAFGVVSVGPAYAQRRDGSLLPQSESGDVTAVGCLVRGSQVKGGKKDQYALARPRKGPVASVPEANCTADAGADALDLDNTNRGVTDAMLGRWVQVSGRLESETSKDPDNLRELDVASIRLVPVVPPKPAATPAPSPAAAPPAAPPPAARAPEPTPAPAPAPAAEAPRTLPKTASPIPAVGLAGLLSLAMGVTLRSFRLRRRA